MAAHFSTSLPWVLLVVGNPDARAPAERGPERVLDEPATLLSRSLALTSIAKTACLVGDSFRSRWSAVTRQLWASNLFSLLPGESVLAGIAGCLAEIRQSELRATVILIPFNHCAVEESTWLASAQGALRLGAANGNTVYYLHDDPKNDPRVALKKPEICTSSVMVGNVDALLSLCAGKREIAMVDLVVGPPQAAEEARYVDVPGDDNAINVVHISRAEEYASLQRGDVWHRTRRVDLHA